jgi:DNA (cytosine-5)-methyltransferase 1
MLRVIREARPAWIIGENVAGIVNLALDTVCADLEAEGYEVEPVIIPACAVDAPHRRDRVWIIAKILADTKESGLEGRDFKGASHMEGRPWEGCATIKTNWLAEPNVGRVAHGVPNRVAKLRGLGNAIVPQVAAEIIRNINIIMEQP